MLHSGPSTQVCVSGALFSAEGKLLLLRRAEADAWELPGGALEFGEAPELGLVRCFREATDMDISVDRPLSAWSALAPHPTLSPGGRGQGELTPPSPQGGRGQGEGADGGEQHRVHLAFVVRLSGALLSVELERAEHAGFAWLARGEALARAGVSPWRAVVEKAFATLAQTRRNG